MGDKVKIIISLSLTILIYFYKKTNACTGKTFRAVAFRRVVESILIFLLVTTMNILYHVSVFCSCQIPFEPQLRQTRFVPILQIKNGYRLHSVEFCDICEDRRNRIHSEIQGIHKRVDVIVELSTRPTEEFSLTTVSNWTRNVLLDRSP